jgi:hypothetical protein
LIKGYPINLKASGGKMGDIVVKIDKGKSREVATNILKKYKSIIIIMVR